eukprot:m.49715 g.49715  ORF g.49715 m.49715 type:complete len:396 (-) comp7148_c0_seq1:109-1296(-)
MSGAVWVTDPGEINLKLFQAWLDGVSSEDAARARDDTDGFRHEVVLQDTIDEYRTFALLKRYMENPLQLSTQTILAISPDKQQELIALYYAYDDAVMREILCKQLSKRLRNDLDEVAEKTKVSLKSCHRQYDNLRRIFRKVEDRQGRLCDLVLQKFALKPQLANNYARLLFIWNNRLLVDKPNLTHLDLNRFLLSSQEIMVQWTSWSMIAHGGSQGGRSSVGDDQNMDRKFLQDLRELKPVIGAAAVLDELCKHCIDAVLQRKLESPISSPSRNASSVQGNDGRSGGDGAERELTGERIQTVFAQVVPSLFQIGAGLSHSRELRDIFEDVVDNVVIPCKRAECTTADVRLLFSALQVGYSQLTTLSVETRDQYASVIRRFLGGLSAITIILYNEQ